MEIKIRQINKKNKSWIKEFIRKNWGSEKVIVHKQIFYPINLPGFAAESSGKILGLITYNVKKII